MTNHHTCHQIMEYLNRTSEQMIRRLFNAQLSSMAPVYLTSYCLLIRKHFRKQSGFHHLRFSVKKHFKAQVQNLKKFYTGKRTSLTTVLLMALLVITKLLSPQTLSCIQSCGALIHIFPIFSEIYSAISSLFFHSIFLSLGIHSALTSAYLLLLILAKCSVHLHCRNRLNI